MHFQFIPLSLPRNMFCNILNVCLGGKEDVVWGYRGEREAGEDGSEGVQGGSWWWDVLGLMMEVINCIPNGIKNLTQRYAVYTKSLRTDYIVRGLKETYRVVFEN